MKNMILDKEEQQLEEALERGEFISTNLQEAKKLFKEAAKNYRELQKTKSVTLRINQEDLIKIKAKAKKNGIAYQTLINLLINQYIKEERKISL